MPNTGSSRRLPSTASGYELREQIGQGTCAAVYRAWCDEVQDEVAIKVVDLEWLQASLEDIAREIKVMSLSSHPNVVPFSTAFVQGADLWVVMPLLTGGSVLSLMNCAYPDGLSEQYAIYVLYCILKALEYFHGNGQIHRDVKAANLMLDSHGNVMLSDYGMMGWMVEGGWDRKQRQTFVGTPCWMAPEVMEQASGYDYKADVWSLGITAIELAEGRAPYTNYPPMKVLFLTLQNPPPTLTTEHSEHFSQNYIDFVSQCLQKDPKERPTVRQLLKHPLFSPSVLKPADLTDTIAKLPPIGSRGGSQKQLVRQLRKVAEAGSSGIYNLTQQGLGWDFGDDPPSQPSSGVQEMAHPRSLHHSQSDPSPELRRQNPTLYGDARSSNTNVSTTMPHFDMHQSSSSVASGTNSSQGIDQAMLSTASLPAMQRSMSTLSSSSTMSAPIPNDSGCDSLDHPRPSQTLPSISTNAVPAKTVGLLKKGRFIVSDVVNPDKLGGKIDSFLDDDSSLFSASSPMGVDDRSMKSHSSQLPQHTIPKSPTPAHFTSSHAQPSGHSLQPPVHSASQSFSSKSGGPATQHASHPSIPSATQISSKSVAQPIVQSGAQPAAYTKSQPIDQSSQSTLQSKPQMLHPQQVSRSVSHATAQSIQPASQSSSQTSSHPTGHSVSPKTTHPVSQGGQQSNTHPPSSQLTSQLSHKPQPSLQATGKPTIHHVPNSKNTNEESRSVKNESNHQSSSEKAATRRAQLSLSHQGTVRSASEEILGGLSSQSAATPVRSQPVIVTVSDIPKSSSVDRGMSRNVHAVKGVDVKPGSTVVSGNYLDPKPSISLQSIPSFNSSTTSNSNVPVAKATPNHVPIHHVPNSRDATSSSTQNVFGGTSQSLNTSTSGHTGPVPAQSSLDSDLGGPRLEVECPSADITTEMSSSLAPAGSHLTSSQHLTSDSYISSSPLPAVPQGSSTSVIVAVDAKIANRVVQGMVAAVSNVAHQHGMQSAPYAFPHSSNTNIISSAPMALPLASSTFEIPVPSSTDQTSQGPVSKNIPQVVSVGAPFTQRSSQSVTTVDSSAFTPAHQSREETAMEDNWKSPMNSIESIKPSASFPEASTPSTQPEDSSSGPAVTPTPAVVSIGPSANVQPNISSGQGLKTSNNGHVAPPNFTLSKSENSGEDNSPQAQKHEQMGGNGFGSDAPHHSSAPHGSSAASTPVQHSIAVQSGNQNAVSTAHVQKRKSRFEVKDVPSSNVSNTKGLTSRGSGDRSGSSTVVSTGGGVSSVASKSGSNGGNASQGKAKSRFEVKDVEARPKNIMGNGPPAIVSIPSTPSPGERHEGENVSKSEIPSASPSSEAFKSLTHSGKVFSLMSDLQKTIEDLVAENEALRRENSQLKSKMSGGSGGSSSNIGGSGSSSRSESGSGAQSRSGSVKDLTESSAAISNAQNQTPSHRSAQGYANQNIVNHAAAREAGPGVGYRGGLGSSTNGQGNMSHGANVSMGVIGHGQTVPIVQVQAQAQRQAVSQGVHGSGGRKHGAFGNEIIGNGSPVHSVNDANAMQGHMHHRPTHVSSPSKVIVGAGANIIGNAVVDFERGAQGRTEEYDSFANSDGIVAVDSSTGLMLDGNAGEGRRGAGVGGGSDIVIVRPE